MSMLLMEIALQIAVLALGGAVIIGPVWLVSRMRERGWVAARG